MNTRRITSSDIRVGQALAFDVYGAGGHLLARKGHLIVSERQAEALIGRGMTGHDSGQRTAETPPSVLRLLNLANAELHAVLGDIVAGGAHAGPRLARVNALVSAALDLERDVALACILHNQGAGPYASRHSIDCALVALIIARALKLPAQQTLTLTLAALSMNVGLLRHHERLQQSGAPLAPADVDAVHAHPEAGAALLRRAGIDDQDWLTAVRQHHENIDGSGYPQARRAGQIVQAAAIIALADRYCARLCARAWRKTRLPNAALRDILLEGKETLDGQLCAVLIRELGIYPVGTVVRLLNGEIGIVTSRGGTGLTPYVHALVGPRGARLDAPLRRDTRGSLLEIRTVLGADLASLEFRLDQVWGTLAAP